MRLRLFSAVVAVAMSLIGSAQAERLTDQPLVDAAWLKSKVGNESLVVIDVRDIEKGKPDPYKAGHVPGAVNAPYSTAGWRATVNGVPGMLPPVEQIEATIAGLGVDNDSHVVIVAAGTDSSEFGAATRVYWTFKVLGHDAVSILDGGWRAWQAAGGEATDASATPAKSDFKAHLRPEMIPGVADVEKALANGTTLVDGRPAAQYRGEAKSPVVRAAGTIPGAVNIENDKFYDKPNASFVSRETVASLAKDAGLADNEEAIAFCNTGHWASIAWFGLSEVQGNKNVKMYDGSMAEWAADPARPVK
ncbi:MAG TPA: sulfurtransferase [Rhizobiaceae bacterium]|nr:sulfurtransferase [Rhizobiaceae bacterium]